MVDWIFLNIIYRIFKLYLKSVATPKFCVFLCFHFMIYKELALSSEHRLKRHFNFHLRVILKPHQLFFMCSCFLSTNYCSRQFYFTTHFRREGMKGNQLIYKCFTNSRSDPPQKSGGGIMNQNFFRNKNCSLIV